MQTLDKNGKLFETVYSNFSLENEEQKGFDVDPNGEYPEKREEMRKAIEDYIVNHLPDGIEWDGSNLYVSAKCDLDPEEVWKDIFDEAVREVWGV